MAKRYEKQYIDRSRSIFGADAPQNQPAYVGQFLSPGNPAPELIGQVEKTIQKAFLDKVGDAAALFALRGFIQDVPIKHQGLEIPTFLDHAED